VTRSTLRRRVGPAAVACAATLVLAACGGNGDPAGGGSAGGDSNLSGPVLVDGSSTVEPLTSAAAELYADEQPGVDVTVATSGTGGGFKKFCAGETDILNASRTVKDEEAAECQAKSIGYVELRVANDALAVVVNKENTWANCLTVDQLRRIWEPVAEGQITMWSQVDPSFPPEPLALFGPGTDSGTFDHFTTEINGVEGASRADYSSAEDDNVLVRGVQGSRGAIGYFGYTYFNANRDKLKAVQIDGGGGCVTPSAEAVQESIYTPLARPLFIYVSKLAYQSKPQVKGFVDFYVSDDREATERAGFVELNDAQNAELASAASQLGSS